LCKGYAKRLAKFFNETFPSEEPEEEEELAEGDDSLFDNESFDETQHRSSSNIDMDYDEDDEPTGKVPLLKGSTGRQQHKHEEIEGDEGEEKKEEEKEKQSPATPTYAKGFDTPAISSMDR